MINLIYTIADGLVEVERILNWGALEAGGTYVKGRPNSSYHGQPLPLGWYRCIHITDTLLDPYWHWEKVNKNELPKKLKAWALIMGIEL